MTRSRFSLTWKLLLVPVIAILSFSGYLVYSSLVLSSSNNKLQDIRDSQFPALDLARENIYAFKSIITELNTAAASGETEPLELAQNMAEEVRGHYLRLEGIDPEHKEEFGKLLAEFNDYFSRSLDISRRMATKSVTPGSRELKEMQQARDIYMQHAAAYRDQAEQRFLMTVAEATRHAKNARQLGPAIGAAMVLALTILTFLVTRGILALYGHQRYLQGSLVAKSHEAETAKERANAAENRIITISEDTQRRIGQELHDDLGQQLTGIAFMSEILAKRLQDENHPAVPEAAAITALVNEAISKTRKLAQGLYPVALDESGLQAMLENLVQIVNSVYPVECELVCEGGCSIVEPMAAINLFRIAQEAVNNAIKHGKAKTITLRLAREHEEILLEIIDNGVGISNAKAAGDGLGMHSMRYRASLLGGSFQLEGRPEGGAIVRIGLPIFQ